MQAEKIAQALIEEYNRLADAEYIASLKYHYMELNAIAYKLDKLGYEILGYSTPYTIKRR